MKRREISFKAGELRLVGEVYFPEVANQLCPALCICHGIPAVPRGSGDRGYVLLAERFCAAGFVTLIFNFRGTGQSEGNLDMWGWTQDLEAAIDFLFSLDEVDKSRICLLGSSGGAAVSVYAAAHDPRISYVVTLACPAEFDLLFNKQQAKPIIDHFRSIGLIRDMDFPLSVDDWLDGFNRVSPIHCVDKISPRPLLLIHGDKDDLVTVEHAYRLYERAKVPKEIHIIPGAGHRLRLEEEAIVITLNWFKARFRLTPT